MLLHVSMWPLQGEMPMGWVRHGESRVLRLLLLATGVSAFCFYYGLGSYPLLNNNEGLYAEIPREMLVTDDYIIPHVNGVPYVEKPPLLYWMIALSYAAFGVSETAARLAPATLSFLGGLALASFLWRQKHYYAAPWALLIWGSSVGVIAIGRTILFEAGLVVFLAVALMSFYIWAVEGRKLFLRLFFAALGLAILTKGFVALALAGLTISIYFAVEWQPQRLFSFARVRHVAARAMQMCEPLGVMIFIVIAAPWHIAAACRDTHFAWFYFINEHVYRFLDMRVPRDYRHGPIYHYIPLVLGYLFPWSLLLVTFIMPRRTPAGNAPLRPTPDGNLRRFLWTWFLVFLAFFSACGSKADYYMLVGMPPLVMLLALRLRRHSGILRSRLLQGVILATVSCILCGVIALQLAPMPQLRAYMYAISPAAIWAVALVCAGVLGVTVWSYNRWPLIVPCFGVFAVCAAVLAATLPAMERWGGVFSCRGSVAEIRAENADAALYYYGDFEVFSTFAFYAGHEIPVIDSMSADLAYGSVTRPDLFVRAEQFKLSAPRSSYVLMEDKFGDQFMAAIKPAGFRLWKRFGRFAIYTNALAAAD
jgi:4-amino-4-deoxy-L-arabinose transferase-like glycosyltransferase